MFPPSCTEEAAVQVVVVPSGSDGQHDGAGAHAGFDDGLPDVPCGIADALAVRVCHVPDRVVNDGDAETATGHASVDATRDDAAGPPDGPVSDPSLGGLSAAPVVCAAHVAGELYCKGGFCGHEADLPGGPVESEPQREDDAGCLGFAHAGGHGDHDFGVVSGVGILHGLLECAGELIGVRPGDVGGSDDVSGKLGKCEGLLGISLRHGEDGAAYLGRPREVEAFRLEGHPRFPRLA